MSDFIVEISSYFATGWVAVLEKTMIFFMVLWIGLCVKLYFEADDGVKPIYNDAIVNKD